MFSWSGFFKVLLAIPRRTWRFIKRATLVLFKFGAGVLIALVVLFSLGSFVFSTSRFGAYRTLHPATVQCQAGLNGDGWTALADRAQLGTKAAIADDNGWRDPSNDEIKVITKDKSFAEGFRCALQKHLVRSSGGKRNLSYFLGFLEFMETGEPYPLVADADNKEPTRDLIYPAHDLVDPAKPRPIEPSTQKPTRRPLLTQLDVLKDHLLTGPNYVIVFIHGWRHNAEIGDGNVADLRHYAAHAARFLQQRCEETKQAFACEARVTAIYVGWRGARVDEARLARVLGRSIGGTIGTISALATLFDRKPVSEQVAPGAISAIRGLDRILSPNFDNGDPKPKYPENRMIVFGHSLGGNMLATGLEADLIKLVRMHSPGQSMPSALGNLIVLINPASEATKWTSIQREVWSRIPYHVDKNTPIKVVAQGHDFFPADQRPVVVSITSALAFPPSGLRRSDCTWLRTKASESEKNQIYATLAKGENTSDYDWATQELFPVFKFDFRPFSLMIQRWAGGLEGRKHYPGQSCDVDKVPTWRRVLVRPIYWLAQFVSNFPFQNTKDEFSHTIGHLDPPRPTDGLIVEKQSLPGAPFGTTHELFGYKKAGTELHNAYATLADADLACPVASYWLSRARKQEAPHGTFWDSNYLGSSSATKPAEHFLHGAYLSGSNAITHANDPFWNMRAFDSALARHDGYRLSSFICAMNQLVMDDITGLPSVLPSQASDPSQDGLAQPQADRSMRDP